MIMMLSTEVASVSYFHSLKDTETPEIKWKKLIACT